MTAQIAEVKQFFATHKAQYDEQALIVASHRDPGTSQSALIFGSVNAASEADVIALFPSRYLADILISRFFGDPDPTKCMIYAWFCRHAIPCADMQF